MLIIIIIVHYNYLITGFRMCTCAAVRCRKLALCGVLHVATIEYATPRERERVYFGSQQNKLGESCNTHTVNS